jgi:hypothetical protein
MDIVYSPHRHALVSGRQYRNPRFFTAPDREAKAVYIVGDYPKIAAAYAAIGVPVWSELDVEESAGDPIPVIDRGAVHIPGDWRDLPWTHPDESGLSLRHLGALLTAEPVINKAQATAAIEAEVARRGVASVGAIAANGPDRHEITANLQALGVEFDPQASTQELAELHGVYKEDGQDA